MRADAQYRSGRVPVTVRLQSGKIQTTSISMGKEQEQPVNAIVYDAIEIPVIYIILERDQTDWSATRPIACIGSKSPSCKKWRPSNTGLEPFFQDLFARPD